MKGIEAFLTLFGNVTISDVALVIAAIVFMIAIYKRVKKYFNDKVIAHNERAEIEKKRDSDIKEALEAVRKYPEYRQQSIKIQELLERENQETRQQSLKIQALLEEEIQELRIMIQDDKKRLLKIEEQDRRRECNRLRDILLQNYRYYTDQERNPSQSWTRMESEAFWDLFRDYEDLGGDGYMHTEVQPAMEKLNIVSVGKK